MLPLRDNVPTRSRPLVTYALIVANILVWVLYQLPDLQGSVDELAYHPCEVEGSCPTIGQGWLLTVFTSMFLHGSWAHLLGNMLFLWIFGNNVEDALGKVRFLLFYVAGGLVATAVQIVRDARLRERARGDDPERRRQRRHLGRARRLPGAAAAREGADADRLRPPRDPGRASSSSSGSASSSWTGAPRSRTRRKAAASRSSPTSAASSSARSPSSCSSSDNRSPPRTDDLRGARHRRARLAPAAPRGGARQRRGRDRGGESRRARPLRPLRLARVHAGQDLDLPAAARRGLSRIRPSSRSRSASPSCTSSRTTSAWTRTGSPTSATTEPLNVAFPLSRRRSRTKTTAGARFQRHENDS